MRDRHSQCSLGQTRSPSHQPANRIEHGSKDDPGSCRNAHGREQAITAAIYDQRHQHARGNGDDPGKP